MWARLAAQRSEDAIEPYFACVTMRQAVKELGPLPGKRHLQFDSRTGLSPEVPLAGFDRSRAAAALPQLRARIRKLGTTSPPGFRLYVAALALAANDAAVAESELAAIGSPARSVAELADALRAQAMFVRGQKREALSRLEKLRNECLVPNRALIDYLCGVARLGSGSGNPADGVLDLLNVAASHDGDQPALAAAALYAAQHALEEQHDAASARAVQIELLRPAKAAAALDVHRRLASALADFPDRVRSNPTLRLVYLRMSRYALDAGEPQVALRYLGLLQIAKPDDPEILRLAGLANAHAGHADRALECWRKLLERLPGDSEAWFEARFNQIESLAQVDRVRARRVWEQFQILHPELGPGAWPERFKQLGAQLR